MVCVLAACGDDHPPAACDVPAFAVGDPNGHADPLGSGPTEARAGRVTAADLPVVPSGLITWAAGDFVLANDKVALVIEDVGDSDLYDPWGGRPVGLARVDGGAMVEPNNFGELFLLVGRSTLVTDSVSVIADGSDGGPATIRAHGHLQPLPFYEAIIAVAYPDGYEDLDAAIDYTLAPGAEVVDVTFHVASTRATETDVVSTLHAFMYTSRTPVFQPDLGFSDQLSEPYLALVDDVATSWAYIPATGQLGSSISAAGFVGAFTDGYAIPACGVLDKPHASIVIGGPGLDGVQAAVARVRGDAQRQVTGTLTRNGAPLAGIHVHATDGTRYLTRATTAADGTFTVNVPADADVTLTSFSRGDPLGTQHVGSGATAAIDLPAVGTIHVVATDNGVAAPVRVQVVPAAGQTIPTVPDSFGEASIAANRLHIAFPPSGTIDLPAPPGDWKVIVSRGYEYELVEQTVTVVAGQTVNVDATLDRVVDTTGTLCGDFHVHTWRSNDSGDDGLVKVEQAVADGLEMPVRSDHEYVGDFASEIATLGVQAWAVAIGSVELTSFQIWGHMGVFPLVADPTKVNAGAPKWQTFPTASEPDTPFTTMTPPQVFDAVRARPEAPVIIINHPRSSTDYFTYVGLDRATGIASDVSDWDTKFTLVEVFNNASWTDNRDGIVEDWMALLRSGRKIFAVGSSDSHRLSTSPVGYPRTCVAVGTDTPGQVTANQVRDALAAGHGQVTGGIYVGAKIGATGPGDTTTGAGSPMTVDVTVQAASWVDVTTVELIVDGHTVDTIPVMPGDADGANPTIRFHKSLPITVQATGGFVVVAAYGAQPLEPVHPGHLPFGVIEPIFVTP